MKTLAVDDEFVALSKMTAILSTFGECDAATNGEQAFEMYMKALEGVHPYELVTIDIEMPGMDGLTLLARICEEEKRQQARGARKIMISAASSAGNVKAAAVHRCDGFLVKPIKNQALLQKLAEIGLIQGEQAAVSG
jgi:two-component system, chemotaxis family, chemotaxis protein CheY